MSDTPVERAPGADRLALALDTDDLVAALRTARTLAPWFGTAKVGLELFSAAGPDAVTSLANLGFAVFVDLKMFDIPTTVYRAARVVGSLGGGLLTLHAAGGQPMLTAGVEGLAEGASSAGLQDPVAVAVTVLTSESEAPAELLVQRVTAAVLAGCGGVVCAAPDLPTVLAAGPGLHTVVPGIRPAGGPADDQRRVATPATAIVAGAHLLVVGRAVTGADDPSAAAAMIASEVAAVIPGER
jgi:orotidine-5'-phosphate decarboxylase